MIEELTTKRIITVDGMSISYEEGDTYLKALKRSGIDIPTLCYEPELIATGSCRICMIEVQGVNNLVSACSNKITNKATVFTKSDKVISARKTIIQLILASHPLKCIVCDKQGNCTLEKLAYEYIPADELTKYEGKLPTTDLLEENEFFKLDYSMCIRCGKCVQVVDEIQHCDVLSMENRGFDIFPSAGFNRSFKEAECVACGNCVAVCPVDALKPLSVIGGGREVDFERVKTTCVYCGVGCQLELVVNKKENKITYVDSDHNNEVNNKELCVKGRFGWDFIHHPDRLNYPLIRKNGELAVSSWTEAYDLIESKYKEVLQRDGPEVFSFLSSAKCTNEENYLMQKFSRAAIGTNNIDHCARLCHASTVTGLVRTFGSGAMTNSIDDLINDSKVIFVIGSNTTEAHPVLGVRIKKAVREGKIQLIVADPRKIELARIANVHIQQKPGTDIAIINAMLKVVLDEKLVDLEFIEQRTEGYEELVETLEGQSLLELCSIAGAKVEDIISAAKIYASSEASAIVYSMGITQHSTGTHNVISLANLAMVTGNIGKPGTGVNPLRGQNNVQGACDLGALPNVYPGYQLTDNPETREFFADYWKSDKVTLVPGLTVVEIMHAAHVGQIKVMHIMGENPALSDPNVNKVRAALDNLEFLVVQDLFLTETAKYADVVLPVLSFAEKDGTFTNTERRVQRVRAGLKPIEQRKSDWEILNELLIRFGQTTKYASPSQIFDEIKEVTPIYSGMDYANIDEHGIPWPCTPDNKEGTKILHTQSFTRGKGRIYGIDPQDSAELPDEDYPFILSTGRNLYHFHTGEMTHRSKGLHERRPVELTELNPDDAIDLGVKDGEKVRLSTRRGTLVTQVQLTKKVQRGVLFMTFHHKEAAANLLTNDVLDPYAKIPELKVCAVKIEKINPENKEILELKPY